VNAALLDDPAERRRLDPGGMLDSITALPAQCREAWQAALDFELPPDYRDIGRIAVLGMGGSAIAGDLWRALLERESAIPVFNVRRYDLPPLVDARTLVIASSFSGDTEETVSAFEQSLATPAKKLVITTGGRLLATARANGVPAFTYSFRGEPRAALGWSLMPLLSIGRRLGLMQGVEADVQETISVLESTVSEAGEDVPASANPAKQLAGFLFGKLPVIYGAGPLLEVAHRWKTQLNESSKVWSFYEELPEAHHNAIIGYALPEPVAVNTTVVLLHSRDLIHPRVALRYDLTRRLLDAAGIGHQTLPARGRSALAQMMSLVLLGDYTSGYLALLYGVDPTPTTVIDELKAWLAAQA
jgi:glucose/mannose-6-phosphate isomerase